jgi:hypothetical protein
MRNKTIISSAFLLGLLLPGCAPNLLHVMEPFDKDPGITVIYRPAKIYAEARTSRPFLVNLLLKNDEDSLPDLFREAAEIFTQTLAREYPLRNIRLAEKGADGDAYLIYFNLDSSYSDDRKKNTSSLNFMVTVEVYPAGGGKRLSGATITAFSEGIPGIFEDLAELREALPPEELLDRLKGRVRRGTLKWVRHIKGSEKYLEDKKSVR